ncbi:hypothetical protein BV22DRAFT_1010056, partial [Leucogyrophana mollusca]
SNSVSTDDTRTQPSTASMSVDPAPTPAPALDYHIPVSEPLPTVAANTSAQRTESHTSSSAASQPKLDQFDITTFDFTAPSSWEALGKMWQATYGYPPSQEELMQFIMAGGAAAAAPVAGQLGGAQTGQWMEGGWNGSVVQGGHGYRGTGRGGRGRGGYTRGGHGGSFGHGNYQDSERRGYNAGYDQHSDAIVLGGDSDGQDDSAGATMQLHTGDQNQLQENNSSMPQAVGTGGRMQRVGDKWVFVKGQATSEAS